MPDEQLFRVALLIGLAAMLPIMVYHRAQAHTPEPLDRRQEGIFILATLRPIGLAFIAGTVVYAVNPSRMAWSALGLPAPLRWVGFALILAAAPLLWWTLHSLGTNLTDTVVTRKVHTLVVRGPYHWMRHPFYCCVALLAAGVSLLAGNWFLMASGALAVTLMAVRTPIEEARLVARFGDDYRRYMAVTNRFVPTR